jgi:hypothetical protein
MSFHYLENNIDPSFLTTYIEVVTNPPKNDTKLWNLYIERFPKGGVVPIDFPLPPFILHNAIIEAEKIDLVRRKQLALDNGHTEKIYIGYLEPICAVEIDGISVYVPHCDIIVPVIINNNVVNIG